MTVRELIKKIRDFDGIEIRDFETNKRLVKSFSINKVEKYLGYLKYFDLDHGFTC